MKPRLQYFPGFSAWRSAFFWLLELEGLDDELPNRGIETQCLPDEHSYISVCENPKRDSDADGDGRPSKDSTKLRE
jgi:hypothetical protein